MRNLIIAAALISATSTILLVQRNSLAKTRQENQQLLNTITDHERQSATEKVEVETLRTRVETIRRRLLSNPVQPSEQAIEDTPIPAMPAPETEGAWPAGRPYFYLAKTHIPGLDYNNFDAYGGIHPDVVALFGMTPEEKHTIEHSFRSMMDALRTRELENSVITNTPANLPVSKGMKASMFLAGIPPETEGRAHFESTIREALGPERAQMFMPNAIRDAERLMYAFDRHLPAVEDRIATYVRYEDQGSRAAEGELIISTSLGTSHYPIDWDQEPYGARTRYAHILDRLVPLTEPPAEP